MMPSSKDEQALIWDYYKPRHTHAWNMLVLSWRELDQPDDGAAIDFDVEYYWENFIIRLWLYRVTVNTLTKLAEVKNEAETALSTFDSVFDVGGRNGLKALRDMIEHFDDYAAGKGRGPASRAENLDPWRFISRDRFERGRFVLDSASAIDDHRGRDRFECDRFVLDRKKSYDAAIKLRSDAQRVSDQFIQWFQSSK